MQPEETGTSPPELVSEASTPEILEPQVSIEQELPAAPPPREPFWGYADLGLTLLVIALGFLLVNIVVAAIAFADPHLQIDLTPLILPTTVAAYGIIYLALRLVLGSRYGKPVFRSLGWRPAHFNLVLAGFYGIALALVISLLANLVHTPKIPTPFDKLSSSPGNLALLGIMAVVLAPLFEELFFRGFLQPLFSRSFGTVLGVLVTAMLFGLLHAPEYSWAWQYTLAVTLAGVAFGALRAQTNSIIPGAVMHSCFNAIQVVGFAFTKLK